MDYTDISAAAVWTGATAEVATIAVAAAAILVAIVGARKLLGFIRSR